VADTGGSDAFAGREHVLGALGYRTASTSDDIPPDILAERILGLAQES
jgi:hypothetical protein